MSLPPVGQFALELPKPQRAHLVHLVLDHVNNPSGSDTQRHWLNRARSSADATGSGRMGLISGEGLEIHSDVWSVASHDAR